MKTYSRYSIVLFAVVTMMSLASGLHAQTDEPYYVFAVFETTVTRNGVETSDANPAERRFYVSNVVDVPSRDRSLLRKASKTADDYFTATVVEPMKTKGILHQYYDDGIRINNDVVYRLDTRAEVEALRKEVLDELKEQAVNIFTFTWTYGGKPTGMDMSKPILFYHEPNKPMYLDKSTKPATSKRQ